jgi:predicted GIY-YIG superfamily endonuclease
MTLGLVLLTLTAWLVLALIVQIARWRAQDAVQQLPPPRALPVRRPVRADVPHLLYCYLWATTLRPIYYGISNEPEVRGSRHLTDPDDEWWMRQSTGVMVPIRWLPDRSAARAAERAAIRDGALAGEDLANDHHNPRRRTRAGTCQI